MITQNICSNLLCACVIHSIFGVDIRDTLLIMDEEGIQQIVTFVNQAMTDTRSKEQSELNNDSVLG